MIDNSANWSAANQQWPEGLKQGQAELRALRNLLAEVKDNVNIGLMMFTGGSGSNKNGGYVRFHVRQMTAVNRAALHVRLGGSWQHVVDAARGQDPRLQRRRVTGRHHGRGL